jgi:hypothetical protein
MAWNSPGRKQTLWHHSKSGVVYQWDLDAGSAIDIQNSKLQLYLSSVDYLGALQMASDGKIYGATYGSTWLSIIDDPNQAGTACNFSNQGFLLTSGTTGYGLPNIYPCYFTSSLGPQSNGGASSTELCQKFCIDFYDSSTNNPTSWEWQFPGGTPSSSTDQNPTQICYDNPGIYDITLITSNASGSDTMTLAGYITVYATPPIPVITQNGYTLTSSPAVTYQWQYNNVDIPGATNQSYTITQTGYYTVVISDSGGCVNSFTLYVEITGIENFTDRFQRGHLSKSFEWELYGGVF